MAVENKQVILKGYIEATPKETDLEVKVSHIEIDPPKGSGAILVKNLYLSCDPYMRGRMRDFHGSYVPPFVPGQPLEGFGVSQVVNSDNPDFKPGDYVTGITGWEEYTFIRPNQNPIQQLRKIHPHHHHIPLSFHLGLLGMYFSMYLATSFCRGFIFILKSLQLNQACSSLFRVVLFPTLKSDLFCSSHCSLQKV